MVQRPANIDLRAQTSMSTHSRSLRSPRLHVAGEAPPELSPLDAFALQSRLLARQLKQTNNDGRRVSRLPPLTVQSPVIIQGRSEYFRSMSHESIELDDAEREEGTGLGLKMGTEDLETRPMSLHPRMSCIPESGNGGPAPSRPSQDQHKGRLEQVVEEDSFLGVGDRTGSPEPLDPEASTVNGRNGRQDGVVSPLSPAYSPGTGSPGWLAKQASFDSSLAPPRALFPSRSVSAMSQSLESTTEEPMSQPFPSPRPRKMSSSSALGGQPPALAHYQRSPSISSDLSAPLPRPSLNFSRPMSRSGASGRDTPSRQPSSDSAPSFVLADESVKTPVSINSDVSQENANENQGAAPSYIYSKFVLPRGKNLQHTPPLLDAHQFTSTLDHSILPPLRTAVPYGGQTPPSPPTRPSSSHGHGYSEGVNFSRPSLDRSLISHVPMPQPSPDPSRPSTDTSRASEEAPRSRAELSQNHSESARARTPLSTATDDTASTVGPAPFKQSLASAFKRTAEEHLEKGIELHEKGSLNESTYHLRHAARQKNPTGMLLYALACRHGWGMRPNQREGVEWLRRAAESASVEIAGEEEQIKDGRKVTTVERKTRKAQFALSIYELGVSHMNGWGIEQDKPLALRCFEIAGCECFTDHYLPFHFVRSITNTVCHCCSVGGCGCSC